MPRSTACRTDSLPDGTTLAAATWLASGIVLLGLTPLPLHDATWGWSPAFWLLAAPAILLYARHLCTRRTQTDDLASGLHGQRQLARRHSTSSFAQATAHARGKPRQKADRLLRRVG